MKAKSEVNIQPIFNMLKQTEKAKQAAAEELVSISDPYVPYLSGDTAASPTIHSSVGTTYIEYPLEYANYIYQGQAMKGSKPKHATGKPLVYGTARHPLADPQWDQRALNDHPGVLENVVVEAMLHG